MEGEKNSNDLWRLLLDLREGMAELWPLIDEACAFKTINPDTLNKLRGLNAASDAVTRVIIQYFCGDCGAPPSWVRDTQFAGKFLFCDKCARKHPDFAIDDKGDAFFWKKVKPQKE